MGQEKRGYGYSWSMGFQIWIMKGMLSRGLMNVDTGVYLYYAYYPEHWFLLDLKKQLIGIQYELRYPRDTRKVDKNVQNWLWRNISSMLSRKKKLKIFLPYAGRCFGSSNQACITYRLYRFPCSFHDISKHNMSVNHYCIYTPWGCFIFAVDETRDLVVLAFQCRHLPKALQNAMGRLFPFGIHIIYFVPWKKEWCIVCIMNGVRPDFHGKGSMLCSSYQWNA